MPDALGRPRDNEGRLFVARARRMPFPDALHFGNEAALLHCPDCGREEVRIAASTNNDPFIQIGCKCGFAWMPMQMQKAAMTNSVARRMGIQPATPHDFTTIETDFDVPNDAEA
jgi:predicted RNA-binding Zn-ribbon protein involved in translation (DUF1610 family)